MFVSIHWFIILLWYWGFVICCMLSWDYRLFITLLAPDYFESWHSLSRYARTDWYVHFKSFSSLHAFSNTSFPYFFSSAMTPNALLNPCCTYGFLFHHFFSTNSLVLAPVCKGHSHNIFFCVPQYFLAILWFAGHMTLYCSVFPGNFGSAVESYSFPFIVYLNPHFHCISFSLLSGIIKGYTVIGLVFSEFYMIVFTHFARSAFLISINWVTSKGSIWVCSYSS